MKTKFIISVIGMAAILGSCASLSRGAKEGFAITTNPPGAQVNIAGEYSCVSPCELKRKHKHDFIITIQEEGFKTVEIFVDSRTSISGATAGTAGNAIWGNFVGVGVDALTGAMLKLSPNPVHVVLEPGKGLIRMAAPLGTEKLYEVPGWMEFEVFVKFDEAALFGEVDVQIDDIEFSEEETVKSGLAE